MTRLDRALGEALRREAEARDYRPPSGAETARAVGAAAAAPTAGSGQIARSRPGRARREAACLLAAFACGYAACLVSAFSSPPARAGSPLSSRIERALPLDPEAALYAFLGGEAESGAGRD